MPSTPERRRVRFQTEGDALPRASEVRHAPPAPSRRYSPPPTPRVRARRADQGLGRHVRRRLGPEFEALVARPDHGLPALPALVLPPMGMARVEAGRLTPPPAPARPRQAAAAAPVDGGVDELAQALAQARV